MKISHDGLTIWYGTADAPAAMYGELLLTTEIRIGVYPASPSNRVVVHYCVNQGPRETLEATLTRTDYQTNQQYFCADFRTLPAEARVEYLPILMCAGRQVPDVKTCAALAASFRVGTPQGKRFVPQISQTDVKQGERPTDGSRFPFTLKPLFRMVVSIEAQTIGSTPAGVEIMWRGKPSAGVVEGELTSTLMDTGGSWLTIRQDGVGVARLRLNMLTEDGALISANYKGLVDFVENLNRPPYLGTFPGKTKFYGAPIFLTTNANYLWLNRLQCLGVGEINLKNGQIVYNVYAVVHSFPPLREPSGRMPVGAGLKAQRVGLEPRTYDNTAENRVPLLPFTLEYFSTLNLQLKSDPCVVGNTPDGLKVVWTYEEGTLRGPILNADIEHIGADWMTIRRDGMGILDVRAIMKMETKDGAIISTDYSGMLDLGENGSENFLLGKLPAQAPLTTSPTYLTGYSDYLWLNRIQCIGVGIVDMVNRRVIYDLYALR